MRRTTTKRELAYWTHNVHREKFDGSFKQVTCLSLKHEVADPQIISLIRLSKPQ